MNTPRFYPAPIPFLLLSLMPLPLAAADGMQAVGDIRDAATRYVRSRVSQTAHVESAPLDARLQVPACDSPLQAAAGNGTPGASWNVAVSCAGPASWTLYVPVRVADQQSIVVLSRNLYAGQTITADALRTERRETTELRFGFVSDPETAIGKQLKRPLAAGSALTPDVIAAQPVVRRGQLVSLIGRSGGFEVRAEGKAMADAGAGQSIAVENAVSRRIVQGTVREDGSVEVKL